MNESLHNISEPAISSNEGWQQMHILLNAYLPVNKEMKFTKFLNCCKYISIILTLLLFTTLQLDHHLLQITPGIYASGLTGPSKEIVYPTLTFNSNNTRTVKIKKIPDNFNSFKKEVAGSSFYQENISTINIEDTDRTPPPIYIKTFNNIENTTKNIIEKQTASIMYAPLNALPKNVVSPQFEKSRDKILANGSWNLFGGIGLNAAINGSQNLRPYPVAEARYNVNPHIYIAAGLSAWSPGSTGTSCISKNFYVTDTMNNVSINNETTSYRHLNYMDIPLSLGIKINKNISVQGGIQMSILLNKKTEKIFSVQYPTVTITSSALSTTLEHLDDVRVHNIDYRFIAGVRYSLKHTMIGLTYQHGLQSIGSGVYTNKNSNHVVALNVLFQLR